AIVLIDLLLAGDNAIVIALAARKLPPHLQKKAVLAGTAGAIIVRVALVFFALTLLKLPGLSLAGGLLLYWIAWRLLAKGDDDPDTPQAATFWAAMRTIIIADTVMGLDNILAIAGASRGDWGLVIFGLVLSIPIMVGGSLLILKLMKKAPWLIAVGCGLLAIIAGRMILDDWWVREQIMPPDFSAPLPEWFGILAFAAVFTTASVLLTRKNIPS
ncbi:MAG: TerC family protein, partial [Gammaproteobacteria bacterium WSBS_2016_MAG_OTU1]